MNVKPVDNVRQNLTSSRKSYERGEYRHRKSGIQIRNPVGQLVKVLTYHFGENLHVLLKSCLLFKGSNFRKCRTRRNNYS